MKQNNDYSYILYEKALMPNHWSKMFADAAELGFDGFEISIDESDFRLARLEMDDIECSRISEYAKREGIRLQSVCFSGQRRYPMGSRNPALVKHSLELMKKCIRMCVNIGIRTIQVAGFDVYYEDSSPETYKRYIENLAQCVKTAEQYGVMLAIEPVEKGVLSVSMAVDIVNQIHSPFLQVYPDIANMAALGIDYFSEIESGIEHCVQFHVRDALPNYYYGVDIGTGIIDFRKTFDFFNRLDVCCPLTLEMWNLDNPDYMNSVSYAIGYLKRAAEESFETRRMEEVV